MTLERKPDVRCLRAVTGFVPQDDVLHGELTVKENLSFQVRWPGNGHVLDMLLSAYLQKTIENSIFQFMFKKRSYDNPMIYGDTRLLLHDFLQTWLNPVSGDG